MLMDNVQAIPINLMTIVVTKMDVVGMIVRILITPHLIITIFETFQTANGSLRKMGHI